MARPRHSNKEIEAALEHAEEHGWTVKLSKGHSWGQMICPKNNEGCRGGGFCLKRIWSTPKKPQNHAKLLKKVVDKCEFLDDGENNE